MAGPVTIIGAAGFVGRRLTQRLKADGVEVFAPSKGDPALLTRDLGLVFYCAGLTADYDQRPFDTVAAHASLLSEVIRAARFQRLVYLSSTRLYDSLPLARADEYTPLTFEVTDPRRVYDLSKALGENLTLARTNGRGSVARLGNVFDGEPGAPGFLSEWMIRARTERRLVLDSSPNIRRDYIHLDDVVSALVAIGETPEGIFNVAGGRCVSNGEIAAVFRERGWEVELTGSANPPTPPAADITRLKALSVHPRSVEDVVGDHLRGLGA